MFKVIIAGIKIQHKLSYIGGSLNYGVNSVSHSKNANANLFYTCGLKELLTDHNTAKHSLTKHSLTCAFQKPALFRPSNGVQLFAPVM